MKKTITLLSFLVLAVTSSFAITNANWQMKINSIEEFKPISANLPNMDMNDFLELSPKKYKELTGKKMSFKERLKLKAAQKFIKRNMKKQEKKGKGGAVDTGIYILLAIFALAWIVMGVEDDWTGTTWVINLVLYLLLWLPGLIHALIVKDDYT